MKVHTKRLKDSHHFVTIEEKHRRFSLCREDMKYQKGTDITDITEEEIERIEKWKNSYPRKLFNGKSSKEMYDIELEQYIS